MTGVVAVGVSAPDAGGGRGAPIDRERGDRAVTAPRPREGRRR
jgi:hypothetical protein